MSRYAFVGKGYACTGIVDVCIDMVYACKDTVNTCDGMICAYRDMVYDLVCVYAGTMYSSDETVLRMRQAAILGAWAKRFWQAKPQPKGAG